MEITTLNLRRNNHKCTFTILVLFEEFNNALWAVQFEYDITYEFSNPTTLIELSREAFEFNVHCDT